MWLVDTNIVSYVLRGDELGRGYQRRIGARAMGLTWMSYGELLEGAYRSGWERDHRMARLEHHLNALYTLVEADVEVFRIWGRIRADRQTQPIATDDALIAATARRYRLPLVTHNPDDFIDTGVRIITLHDA